MQKYYAFVICAALLACSESSEEADATVYPDASPRLDSGIVLPRRDATLPEDSGPSEDVPLLEDLPLLEDAPLLEDLPPEVDEGIEEDAAPPPEDPLVAVISLAEVPAADDLDERASAVASIVEEVEIEPSMGCVVMPINPNTPVAERGSYDGGAITVEGTAGGALTFNHDGDGYVAARALNGDVFTDGASLTASGEGGPHFPAFSVQLTAPASVQMSAPGNFHQQSSSADLNVAWAPGAAESLLITVIPVDLEFQPMSGNWIFCGAEDNGSFSVPSAHLVSTLNGNFLGQAALVAITRTRVSEVELGEHAAVLSASTSGGALITIAP